jgi:hypothetical protein
MIAQQFRELQGPRKMYLHHTFGSSRKNSMARVGSSRNGWATIGIPPASQHDMLRDFARYATVGKVKIRRIWGAGFTSIDLLLYGL